MEDGVMNWSLVFAVLYYAVGVLCAVWIVARTWWDHWKTAVPGAIIAALAIPLWLPGIIIIALVVCWAFWERKRRVSRRYARHTRRRRRELDATKDKHGINDAEVTARVIEEIRLGKR